MTLHVLPYAIEHHNSLPEPTSTIDTQAVMALHVLPYTVEHYNSLPELRVAKKQFESARASDILFTEIGQVFVKHHVENTLGIALLHNHFLLEQHDAGECGLGGSAVGHYKRRDGARGCQCQCLAFHESGPRTI